jgi:uncharacterized protein (TIGR00299 family) protein
MTGFSKIVVIDAQASGVAGDMILGALLDLGADQTKVTAAIKSLEREDFGYKNINIDIQKVMKKGFRCTKIDVTAEGKNRKDGHQLIRIVEQTVENLGLSVKAKQFTSSVIRTLVDTEAKLHSHAHGGHHLDDAHLHEVGLVDTAAEIVGTAVALEDLGLFNAKMVATPISVGGGLFTFSHGTVAAPSPAALAILQSKNFPFQGGPVESELATPTGVSVIVNLASEALRFYPQMIPEKVGYGAGCKDFPDVANLLRIVVGKPLQAGLLQDQIAVLETNIDDVPGEIIGYSIERLLAEGAKDVSLIPIYTKKNRPGQIIKVIADQDDAAHLSRVLVNETGTLGVRVYFCERHIVSRESRSVEVLINGNKEPIKIKVSKSSQGDVVRIKPEFEDLKRIAEKTGKPLRELYELALTKAHEAFNSEK